MKKLHLTRCLIVLLAAASMVSCAPAKTSPNALAQSTPLPSTETTSDPFAYCATAGTIDTPDARYTGPQMPQAIAEAIKKASGASADAPLELFTKNSFWRCMDGKVYGCTVGANLPCMTKVDVSPAPTPEEIDFCKANPSSDFIPAVVTGRATVYEWRCTNGEPKIVRQIVTPDARGFQSNIWYRLNP